MLHTTSLKKIYSLLGVKVLLMGKKNPKNQHFSVSICTSCLENTSSIHLVDGRRLQHDFSLLFQKRVCPVSRPALKEK